MPSLLLACFRCHLMSNNISKFEMADTMGRINVCTSELSHQGGCILGIALFMVLYVPFASGLWSLVVEAFERGISVGVKKHEFRPPLQSRLLSHLREDSDGEARRGDLLIRTGNLRISPSSG